MSLPTSHIAILAELSYRGVEKNLEELAKELTAKALFIGMNFTRSLILKYIRKALRLGVWRYLKPESRALLLALTKWGKSIRSKTLQQILTQIFLEIELNSTRGKAIFYGIIVAFSRTPQLLTNIAKNINKILILGIQYTNLPPIYRVFG